MNKTQVMIGMTIILLTLVTTALSADVNATVGNSAPDITVNHPVDGDTGISLSTTLNITVTDSNEDPMNVTFYTSNQTLCSENNVSSGTTLLCNWSELAENTTYTWHVNATDGTDKTSEEWNFTTEWDYPTPKNFTVNNPDTYNPNTKTNITVDWTDLSSVNTTISIKDINTNTTNNYTDNFSDILSAGNYSATAIGEDEYGIKNTTQINFTIQKANTTIDIIFKSDIKVTNNNISISEIEPLNATARITSNTMIDNDQINIKGTHQYRFEEGTGNTTTNTWSEETAQLIGNPEWVSSKGTQGTGNYSLKFNGTNYVNTTINDIGGTGKTEKTITTWVNFTSLENDSAIVTNDEWGATSSLLLWGDKEGFETGTTNTISAQVSDGTDTAKIEGPENLSLLNEWQFVALTFKANSEKGLKLYVNGDFVDSKDTTNIDHIEQTPYSLIGGATPPNGRNMKGTIDELRIYNEQLSKHAINTLRQQGYPATHNLELYKDGESIGKPQTNEVKYQTTNLDPGTYYFNSSYIGNQNYKPSQRDPTVTVTAVGDPDEGGGSGGGGGGGYVPPEEEPDKYRNITVSPAAINMTLMIGDTVKSTIGIDITSNRENESINITSHIDYNPYQQKYIDLELTPSLVYFSGNKTTNTELEVTAPKSHPLNIMETLNTYETHLEIQHRNQTIEVPVNIKIVENYKIQLPDEIQETHTGNKMTINFKAKTDLSKELSDKYVTFTPTGNIKNIITNLNEKMQIQRLFNPQDTETIELKLEPEENTKYTGNIKVDIKGEPEKYQIPITLKPKPEEQETITKGITGKLTNIIKEDWNVIAGALIVFILFLTSIYIMNKNKKIK